MSKYKWKYMSDEMLEEMNGLLKSEHGATLLLWSKECADAGVKGFTSSIGKGILLGIGVGTVVGIGKIIKEKIEHKRFMKELEEKPIVKVDVDI